MRKCQVTYQERDKKGKYKGKKITVNGLFHTWSVDNGIEAFGLVELSDGKMIGAHPTCIKFEVPDKKEKCKIGCFIFSGTDEKVERLVSKLLMKLGKDRIYKILQSECGLADMVKADDMAIDKGRKSITITIFYYKE